MKDIIEGGAILELFRTAKENEVIAREASVTMRQYPFHSGTDKQIYNVLGCREAKSHRGHRCSSFDCHSAQTAGWTQTFHGNLGYPLSSRRLQIRLEGVVRNIRLFTRQNKDLLYSIISSDSPKEEDSLGDHKLIRNKVRASRYTLYLRASFTLQYCCKISLLVVREE